MSLCLSVCLGGRGAGPTTTVGIGRYRLKWLTGQWTIAEVKCLDVRFEGIISWGWVGAFKYIPYTSVPVRVGMCVYVYLCVCVCLDNKVAAETWQPLSVYNPTGSGCRSDVNTTAGHSLVRPDSPCVCVWVCVCRCVNHNMCRRAWTKVLRKSHYQYANAAQLWRWLSILSRMRTGGCFSPPGRMRLCGV